MQQPTFQQRVAKMLIIDKLDEKEVLEKLEAEGTAPGMARDAVRRVKFAEKRKEREKILGTPRRRYQPEEDDQGWSTLSQIIGVLVALFIIGRALFWAFESNGNDIPILSILVGIVLLVVRLGTWSDD